MLESQTFSSATCNDSGGKPKFGSLVYARIRTGAVVHYAGDSGPVHSRVKRGPGAQEPPGQTYLGMGITKPRSPASGDERAQYEDYCAWQDIPASQAIKSALTHRDCHVVESEVTTMASVDLSLHDLGFWIGVRGDKAACGRAALVGYRLRR